MYLKMKNLAEKIATTNKQLNDSYREYFNNKFEAIKVLNTPYGELGTIIYHMFDATNRWLNRILNEENKIKSYIDLGSEQDFFNEWIKVDNRFISYAKQNSIDYNKIIHVVTSSGEEINLSIEDALLHISHHSFQHRGHLGALVRIHTLDPLPGLDWVDINKES